MARNAVDCVSPAFLRTRELLFQPFRFGMWLRLAIIATVMGEFGGSSGGSYRGGMPTGTTGSRRWLGISPDLPQPDWTLVRAYLPWIVAGIVFLFLLTIAWLYVESVYRFILLDSVLARRCELKPGWRRWREVGRQFFVWTIGFSAGSLAAIAIVIGLPVVLAWRAGWFEAGRRTGPLIAGAILLILIAITLFLILATISVLAQDFLVPAMALERAGVFAGWRRVLGLADREPGAWVGYVLMRLILRVGSAILFGIVDVMALILMLIPLGLLGVILYLLARAIGMTWEIRAMMLVAGLGLLALAAVLCVFGFLYAPGLVFFQSYALEFLGARYPLLNMHLAQSRAQQPPNPTPSPGIAPA